MGRASQKLLSFVRLFLSCAKLTSVVFASGNFSRPQSFSLSRAGKRIWLRESADDQAPNPDPSEDSSSYRGLSENVTSKNFTVTVVDLSITIENAIAVMLNTIKPLTRLKLKRNCCTSNFAFTICRRGFGFRSVTQSALPNKCQLERKGCVTSQRRLPYGKSWL